MKMFRFSFIFLVLTILIGAKCELHLQIIKNYNDFLTPVTDIVEEKAGTSFSLICELIVSNDSKNFLDDNLMWMKEENVSNQTRFKTILQSIQGINKLEKKFIPLLVGDNGNHYCVSRKFNLSKKVFIKTIDNNRRNDVRSLRETIFCNELMFQCVSNGLCIIPHYVCDGKPDCKDSSDESLELCNGDPCKDKIPCDDGRCIPSSWCCDSHHDMNCSVTNRPKCCQVLIIPESYEDFEYPNVNHIQHSGTRYLFISVCIVSILFSIVLLLLIISKVMIFARKTALRQQHQSLCENIALRNRTDVNVIGADFRPSNVYTVRSNSRTPRLDVIIDASEVNDPLLFPPCRFGTGSEAEYGDRPPSYVDVLRSKLISEPPPPYTSNEMLDDHRGLPVGK
ncbi:unnamed protein product [Phaedon cochleariae]|uniref:Uncharacterized protein n=1 Tax=Phaedon cochleariae TaxID=80249 RepID=A0A9N9SB23_PHACE|nr:unnamed protein product [Phaedon cochleariae]